MKKKRSILADIYKDLSLTQEQLNIVSTKFEIVVHDKGDVLIREGEIVKYQYYIFDGCLRSYLIDHVGREHTLQFAIKDWWISDYTAFFSESEAKMSIECIRKSTILRVSRRSMKQLYLEVPKIASFNREKLEKAYAELQKRVLNNFSQTARERYISFINDYPNIEQVVKNYHIASYLGIAAESLSRIRKEIARGQ